MKTFLILLVFSFAAYSMGSKKPQPLPMPPVPSETPTREIAGEFKVDFSPEVKHSTEKERGLIAKAALKVSETVKSGCFKDFMLSARLLETDGKSNAKVLEHILGMVDKVPVKMYLRRGSSAIAYRQPPEKSINLNRTFFNEKKSPCRWAATMAHESLGHSLGNYKHSMKWSIEREYSVPYKLGGAGDKYGGNAFSQCCKD